MPGDPGLEGAAPPLSSPTLGPRTPERGKCPQSSEPAAQRLDSRVRIRLADDFTAAREIERLQLAVWGMDPLEVVPHHLSSDCERRPRRSNSPLANQQRIRAAVDSVAESASSGFDFKYDAVLLVPAVNPVRNDFAPSIPVQDESSDLARPSLASLNLEPQRFKPKPQVCQDIICWSNP
jgi:hypothetical protein